MSIATALSYMYPSAIAGLDYVLMNDGDGDYISEWKLTDIKPTNEQIKAAEIGHLECEAWSAYKAKAQDLLDKTDIVCLRCYKAGVAYPADWQKYTADLRAIVSAKSGDPTAILPPTPAYPAGA